MNSKDFIVGNKYIKTHHNVNQVVVLKEVKRDKVLLQEAERTDTFYTPINKFIKFYKPV